MRSFALTVYVESRAALLFRLIWRETLCLIVTIGIARCGRSRWKNYLFAESDAGGERGAIAYTLIETAKLNGLDPEAYLREVVGRIADHPINRIAKLLP